MVRDYLIEAAASVRRKDRAVEDEGWIRQKLRTAPYGVMATAHDGQPFVNSNLFVYDERERAIYMHTARTGRTASNVGSSERVAFTVFEMGRLLPAPRAFNMSVEYEGVVVFGRARLLESEKEKRRGLGLLVEKYFSRLAPVVDYALPSTEELSLTSVYRIEIESWSGKRKAVEADYAGAFRFGGQIDSEEQTGDAVSMGNDIATRLTELEIELPAVPPIGGTYAHCVRTGDLLFTSGHVPFRADGTPILGRLGESLSMEEGQEAARRAALGLLASLRAELGSLDKVERIVRLLVTVNATADFIQHTQVANGASDLLVEVFGEAGKHARLAVGVASLPFNIALEVEAVVEVSPGP